VQCIKTTDEFANGQKKKKLHLSAKDSFEDVKGLLDISLCGNGKMKKNKKNAPCRRKTSQAPHNGGHTSLRTLFGTYRTLLKM